MLPPRPHPLPPEKLDHLPADNPAAIAGRKDLRLINQLMGNHRWIARQLQTSPPNTPILELGAGDSAHLPAYQKIPQLKIHALDLAPRPPDWPPDWPWTQANLLQQPWPPAHTVIASLVLHHFEPAELQALGQRLQPTSQNPIRRLLLVEPARRQRHLLQGLALTPLIHPLTRHDLALSVRAGFLKNELAPALGLTPQQWHLQETLHPLGSLRLQATLKNQ